MLKKKIKNRCRFHILLVARRGGLSFQDNEAWWLHGNKRGRRRRWAGGVRASQSLLLPLFFLSGSRHADGVAGTRDRGAAFPDNQQNGDTRASEGMEKVTLMESDELLQKKKRKKSGRGGGQKGEERMKSGRGRGLKEKVELIIKGGN